MYRPLIATIALASFSAINAQTGGIPDVSAIPAACGTQCASTIETAVLCAQEYGNVSMSIAACFCSGIPATSELTSCAGCLDENTSDTLGSVLAALPQYCQGAAKSCAFECSFDTCASTDVDCQCGEDYLQNIFNCASCNTRNNNVGQTQVTDYNELKNSCVNQNYTSIPDSTQALPSPTGQDGYVAPTLTNTGGATVSTAGASSGVVVSAGGSSTAIVTLSTGASRAAASSIQSVASSIRSGTMAMTSARTGSVTSSGSGTATSAPANSGFKVAGPSTAALALIVVVSALL